MGLADRDLCPAPERDRLRALVVATSRFEEGWLGSHLVGDVSAGSFDLVYCASGADAIERLEDESFSVCFFDDRLGEAEALRLFAALRGYGSPFPVILLATANTEDRTAKLLHAGAADYLIRGRTNHDLVLRTVRYALERHRSERRERNWQERFQRLFDRGAMGLYRMSADSRILDCNEAMVRILGCHSKEDLVGHQLEEYPESRVPGESSVLTRRGPFYRHEKRLRRREDSPLWVRMTDSLTRGPDLESEVYEGTLIDISELKRSEERVQSMEAEYLAVCDSIAGGMMLLDEEGKITASNQRAGSVFGLAITSLVGQRFTDCFAKVFSERRVELAPQELPPLVALREATATTNTVLGFERWDGEECWVSVRATPVRGPRGEYPSGAILSLTDLSDTKRLEAQLIEAQKMEVVGRLAGGLSHDFRNLLTAISGYADLMRREEGLPDAARLGAEEIQRASERAISLVGGLLSFGRRQERPLQAVDLDKIISDLSGMMNRVVGSRVKLVLELNLGRSSVRADPSRMEQVVMNLVINARDALPDGGRLVLRTDRVELRQGSIPEGQLLKVGPHVRLTVEDDGQGMDEDTRKRVFEPFFTTKAGGKGTGLGLPTVREILRRVGGEVRVVSEPGSGTVVELLLPCVQTA